MGWTDPQVVMADAQNLAFVSWLLFAIVVVYEWHYSELLALVGHDWGASASKLRAGVHLQDTVGT